MSGLGEGLGTAIEGGLLGRAVDPAAPVDHMQAQGSSTCANCGAQVASRFCPECGQKAQLHRSLAAIGHDIMHGVLHLDGKLWHTLPLLAFRPGTLTRRYVDGERAKFVSPMAMFLFTVFAMFAVFQMVGVTTPTEFGSGMFDGFTDNSAFKKQIQGQIVRLEQENNGLPEDDTRRAEIAEEIKVLDGMLSASTDTPTGTDGMDAPVTGFRFLDEGIIPKWKSNPGLMLYKLQTNAYKFSWLLIPLSIPFVWLLFVWRRQFKAYDHAVFVTYSLAFMSLLFIVMSLLGLIPGGLGSAIAVVLLTIAAPVHLYKHLRHAYRLSRLSTLWRFFALLLFINVVIILFLQTLLVLGAF